MGWIILQMGIAWFYSHILEYCLHKWLLHVPHRKKWIQKYLEWEPTPLETYESNHFLRLIEHGVKIKTVEVKDAKISVDTQADLIEVRKLMETDRLKDKYIMKKI